MPDNKGFVLIELLMKAVTVTGFLSVTSMIGIQLASVTSKVSTSREQAYFGAMQWDLENLDVRQAIYYGDTEFVKRQVETLIHYLAHQR